MSPYEPYGFGGDERVRTDDPLLAKQVLSQLSYTPIKGFKALRRSLTPYRTSKIKQRLAKISLLRAIELYLRLYITQHLRASLYSSALSRFAIAPRSAAPRLRASRFAR